MWRRLLKSGLAGATGAPMYTLAIFNQYHWSMVDGLRFSNWDDATFIFELMLSAYLMALPVVLVAIVIIGLPMRYLLERRNWKSGDHHITAGFVSGGVAASLLSFWGLSLTVELIGSGAFGGALAAWVWWRNASPV